MGDRRIYIYAIICFLLSACNLLNGGSSFLIPNTKNQKTIESTTDQEFSLNPTIIIPDTGKGGIVGLITNAYEIWPGEQLVIYAAEFYGEADGDGFYLLEPNIFPKADVDDEGKFQFNNVTPGLYVLVVGPLPETAKVIVDGTKPRIIKVETDEIEYVGNLSLQH